MPDLTDAIRQFDATESNLKRLEDLWNDIHGLIPEGMVIDTSSPDALRYANLCRTFRHIQKAMPKLDDFELADNLLDLDEVFQFRFDAAELGEISATVTIERHIYQQGETLQEYRFRFTTQRRVLVRRALEDAITEVDAVLTVLKSRESESEEPWTKMSGAEWESLKELVAKIDTLRGSAVAAPERWNELHRHLYFGCVCDLDDILTHDWPKGKQSLQAAMYGPDDPVTVETADLGLLVKAAPSGPVVTALKWDAIDSEAFERLVYNLVSDAAGYDNPQWLTHTNAPDRGRDISATKLIEDALSGTRAQRVIIQCKHWRARGIGIQEVTKLVYQMSLWEPPKVDELIIATTGRFASDAIDWIEKHNNERKTPFITMWPDSHLESLLAARPHLVAQFRLR